jgi:uncharacterized protein YpuA (DUF1002 family)
MLKTIEKYLLTLIVIIAMALSLDITAYADSSRIVTLGANLNEEQKEKVLSFFGLTESDLDNMDVIYVNNKQERQYLEGIVADDVIGTKTYSCSYIEPTTSGGINVKTANLTYVTSSILYNTLQTAGVENCNIIVTAPFPVSGTGALTGIFLAFDNAGIELDEEKKEIASEELVTTSELEESYGIDVTNLISDVKDEVISQAKQLAYDEIKKIVKAKAKEYHINLTDEDIDKIVEFVNKLQTLEYDTDTFSTKMNDLKNTITSTIDNNKEGAANLIERIKAFFEDIVNFFKNLFGKNDVVEDNIETSTSIFDDINTDVIQYDDEASQE